MAITIGKTTVGGSSDEWAVPMYSQVIATTSGLLQSISLYSGSFGSYGGNIQFAIYADNSGMPGNRLANTAPGVQSANSWLTLTIGGTKPSIISGTTYWLAWGANNNYSGNVFNNYSGLKLVYENKLHAYPPAVAGSLGTLNVTVSEDVTIYGTLCLDNNFFAGGN